MLFDQAVDIPEIFKSERVSVTLIEGKARYNLRVKAADITAFKKSTGLKLPSKIGSSSLSKVVSCLKLGPDEWLVIANSTQQKKLDKVFEKASKDFICSITDISHRNIGFEVSGELAAKLINVGCPLDLSLTAFPVGKVTRTIFESAQIMLLRTGEDSFHVECWRSFAPYLRDYFKRVMTTRY